MKVNIDRLPLLIKFNWNESQYLQDWNFRDLSSELTLPVQIVQKHAKI